MVQLMACFPIQSYCFVGDQDKCVVMVTGIE